MSTHTPIRETSHGTAVQLNGIGILLRGASGSGKSSIAMRLLDDCLLNKTPGALIADDRVYMEKHDDALYVSAPENLQGLMEIRGLGIVTMDYLKNAKLDLVVDLIPSEFFERYPEKEGRSTSLNGVSLARIHIAERNPDAAAIIRMYLNTQHADKRAKQLEV